jgi:hypothetical protein
VKKARMGKRQKKNEGFCWLFPLLALFLNAYITTKLNILYLITKYKIKILKIDPKYTLKTDSIFLKKERKNITKRKKIKKKKASS